MKKTKKKLRKAIAKGKISIRAISIFVILFLICATALLFLFISERNANQNLTKKPQWKSYNEQVKEGTIEPAGQILEILLTYSVTQYPAIEITSLTKKNGYVPKQTASRKDFVIEYLDDDRQILYANNMTIPDTIHYDYVDTDGKLHGGTVKQDTVAVTLTLPWNERLRTIRILDRSGKIVIEKPLTYLNIIDNTPNFHSIDGETLQNNKNEFNFDMFIQRVLAQNTGKKLHIAFISNGYSDLNAFHTDVTKFSQKFLTYEPYKTRTAQIAFTYVDNTTDLQCKSTTSISRLISCDDQLLTQIVNNAGAPYDFITVINNTDVYGGSGGYNISVMYNGEFGPAMFVHEFGGHTFGRLLDEYAYEGESTEGFLDNNIHGFDTAREGEHGDGNCYAGKPPVATWSGLVTSSDYRLGCSKINWYTSSQSSIMYSITDPDFNLVSQCVMNRRLDTVVEKFSGANPKCYSADSPTISAVPSPNSGIPNPYCLGSCPTQTPTRTIPLAEPTSTITKAPEPTTNPEVTNPIEIVPSIPIDNNNTTPKNRNWITILLSFLLSILMAFLNLFR